MNKRKRIAIASLALATLTTFSLVPVASAHGDPGGGENGKPGKRFEQRMKKRAHKIEKRLDKLMKEGKITEAQKQAILAKLKDNKQKPEELRKIQDPEKRREAIKNLHEEFKQWLKDQGIDPELLKPHKQKQA